MKIAKQFFSGAALCLMNNNILAVRAVDEVSLAIKNNISSGDNKFILNNSCKNCNGVVPVKEKCYQILEDTYGWYREKPLSYFHEDTKKGGPIDVYKEFIMNNYTFRVGLEFETGNISSAHRSINKLHVGIKKDELDLGMLIMPIKNMAFYLTDRVSNYEELEPYFVLLEDVPFIVFGFDADEYSANAPFIPKGRDGMSSRAIRRWQYK